MDKTVAELNIVHFRRLLAAETDPAKRQILEKLLLQEEAKLSRPARRPADNNVKRP